MSHACLPASAPQSWLTSCALGRRAWLDVIADHAWLLLPLMSAALFFYGVNTGDLLRTETLRAQVAQEMLRSGDWLVPRLYGEPLLTKPPGMYLAIVLCSWPLGAVTTWSARLPSALAASAAVFLFAWFFSRRLGRSAGLVAGLVLPMSLMWLDKATSAEIDMLQMTWVLAAIVFFLRAVEEQESGVRGQESGVRSQGSETRLWATSDGHAFLLRTTDYGLRTSFVWWLAALLCVAGGVLTKWTAPQFFYGTVIPYLWWHGRLRLLFRWPHLVSAGIAAALCIGWAAIVASRVGWDNLLGTVAWEGLSRLAPGYNPWRPYPWLESLVHPFKLLVNTLPWSAFALLALRPSFFRIWHTRERQLLVALHCWVWPQMLFWSLPTEHTPRHSFPLFPGLAGLAVMVWYAWHTGRLPWSMPRFRPTTLLLAGLAFWLLCKVVHVEAVVPYRTHVRQTRNKAAVLAALVPEGRVLYVFTIKDEGMMFYCGREVMRRDSPADVPHNGAPAFCLLTEREWHERDGRSPIELMQRLEDSQGTPIYLVRILP